jgi:hypothetical protein
MGIYIYSIRARFAEMEIGGEEKNVHTFQFLRRATTSFYYRGLPGNRLYSQERLHTSRCDTYWENRGGPPEYIVLPSGDHPKKPQIQDGDLVYKWLDDLHAWDYDTPSFQRARRVGWAHKRGTSWEVHNTNFVYLSGDLVDKTLVPKNQKSFWDYQEAQKWILSQNELGLHVSGSRYTIQEGKLVIGPKEEFYPPKHFSFLDLPTERLEKLARMGDHSARWALQRARIRNNTLH